MKFSISKPNPKAVWRYYFVCPATFRPRCETYGRDDCLTNGRPKLVLAQRLVMEFGYDVMRHSLEAMAEITNSPISTEETRMFHARAMLRNLLPTRAGMVLSQ